MLPSANTKPPPDPEEILIEPLTSNLYPGLVVPMPTLPDVVAKVAVPVIDMVDAVTEPVAVSVDTVIEPALSTLKLPALTVSEPTLTVVSVMLSVFAMSLPVIELSTIVELVTESAPTVAGTLVNCDPSPIKPVAVTVPFAKILLRKRTVVVPCALTLADIVPTDKKPPVIVPRFDTVILAAVIEPLSSTTKALFAAVSVPVDAIEEAVTEPVALIVAASSNRRCPP